MKAVLAFACVSLFVAAAIAADTYPTTWDNVNVDEVLGNNRLFEQYEKCLLDDKAKCSPEGNALKKFLPDALKTNCANCTQKQKEGGRKVIKFLVKNKPDVWEKILKKYDPEGIYLKKYAAEFDKIKNGN